MTLPSLSLSLGPPRDFPQIKVKNTVSQHCMSSGQAQVVSPHRKNLERGSRERERERNRERGIEREWNCVWMGVGACQL